MDKAPTFVGVDVAKHRLDVHLRPSGEHFTVGHDEAGVAALVERLTALAPALVVLEATGGMEVRLAAALAAAGLPATVREYELPVEERVAAARRLAAEGISQAEIARYLGVSPRTVRSYMRAGDWCGTPLASPSATHCRPCAARVRSAPRWSAPEILEAMRRWKREIGVQPTIGSWGSRRSALSKWHEEHPAWPSSQQVIARFGSWREAARRARFSDLQAHLDARRGHRRAPPRRPRRGPQPTPNRVDAPPPSGRPPAPCATCLALGRPPCTPPGSPPRRSQTVAARPVSSPRCW